MSVFNDGCRFIVHDERWERRVDTLVTKNKNKTAVRLALFC